MPFIHSEKLNPCKCGCRVPPDLDSDDMFPSWAVQCYSCKQIQHDKDWTLSGAVREWNRVNPIKNEETKNNG